jgi:antitoxin VapB
LDRPKYGALLEQFLDLVSQNVDHAIGSEEKIMAIVIEDSQMESLARQIASAEGVSVDDVVRESLTSLAGLRGLTTGKAPLRERLAALAREVDAIPARIPPDTRGDGEILGYNEQGVG